MIYGFQNEIVQKEPSGFEVVQEGIFASECIAYFSIQITVPVVEKRAAMRRRFADEERRYAMRPVTGTIFFKRSHAFRRWLRSLVLSRILCRAWTRTYRVRIRGGG